MLLFKGCSSNIFSFHCFYSIDLLSRSLGGVKSLIVLVSKQTLTKLNIYTHLRKSLTSFNTVASLSEGK